MNKRPTTHLNAHAIGAIMLLMTGIFSTPVRGELVTDFVTTTNAAATNTFLGNVGVGTSTPAYKLDVTGNLRVTGTGTFAVVTGNGSQLTGITAAQVGAVASNDARYIATLTNGYAASVTLNSNLTVLGLTANDGGLVVANPGNITHLGRYAWLAQGLSSAVIIGSTNAYHTTSDNGYKLNIFSDTILGEMLTYNNGTNNYYNYRVILPSDDSATMYQDFMVDANYGYGRIGKCGPTHVPTEGFDAPNAMYFYNCHPLGTANCGPFTWGFYDGPGHGWKDYEAMRLTAAGNLGIGVTNPAYTLTVNGTAAASNYIGSGASLTGITAAQVGAVASSDARYLTALTNAAAFDAAGAALNVQSNLTALKIVVLTNNQNATATLNGPVNVNGGLNVLNGISLMEAAGGNIFFDSSNHGRIGDYAPNGSIGINYNTGVNGAFTYYGGGVSPVFQSDYQGNVTAHSYTGDGSQLTGITASQVGAVRTNDARFLTSLTNASAFDAAGAAYAATQGCLQLTGGGTVNGPVTIAANFTVAGNVSVNDHMVTIKSPNIDAVSGMYIYDAYTNGGGVRLSLGSQSYPNQASLIARNPDVFITDYASGSEFFSIGGNLQMSLSAAALTVIPSAMFYTNTTIQGRLTVNGGITGNGSQLTGITAAQVGGVSTGTTITINGITGSLTSNLAFTVNGGGAGAVTSVFGRTGLVVAVAGDYTATQVGADPAGAAAVVQANLNSLTNSLASTVSNTLAQALLNVGPYGDVSMGSFTTRGQ